ncbi:MAG: DNA alkylation repair protein [Candidatus Lokiarchaeota archaeon]|nr:DNA alkylation repair protein [Candidatus Lokiarchaeota archaeon]
MIEIILNKIIKRIKENIPILTEEQLTRTYKILNSDNPNFMIYGLKMKMKELIAKEIFKQYKCSYLDTINIFRKLIMSDNEDEQFIGLYFLNNYKKQFNEEIIEIIHDEYLKYCSTWSLCDSTCIKVIAPYLNNKGNEELAQITINEWSNSKNIWIRRASMVILLKLIMLRKEFFISKEFTFNLVEKMLQYKDEDYILKGIGWLLKTCSNYNPDIIIEYLKENKQHLPRLVLRYASEKLPNNIRLEILKK